MAEIDVIVVGAGPAGATAALNLAPTWRVVLVERRADTPPRIGEMLPPAARRLISDMMLLDQFLTEGHLPCYGNRAVWGAGATIETDFLRDPDGNGWHLDRARFDAWLSRVAVQRGAVLLRPARLDAIERDGTRWRVRLATNNGSMELKAALVIDCGGRTAPVARRLGSRRAAADRLVCGWVQGAARPTGRGAGFSVVEAVEGGWWYTAPVPEERRILAFFTDADLPAGRLAHHDCKALMASAMETTEVGTVLVDCAFAPLHSGFVAAHNSALDKCTGPGWIAAGDASICFDPISSQGLLHALFSGLASAEAANRYLLGDASALQGYQHLIDGVERAYWDHLASCYAAETRWTAAPFWRRRSGLLARQVNSALGIASLKFQ